MTIKLTLNAQTLSEGQTVAGGSFISSVADSSSRSITQYSIYDSGADGGHFTLNGVTLANGKWNTVTAAQLAQLKYITGAGVGQETISIEAYDGSQWSAAYSTTATTTAPVKPPSVTASSKTVIEGQTLAASSLIASTSDPNGKAIATYALMDSGKDGTLYYNGTKLTAGAWYDYTAAQLAQVTWVAGSSVGAEFGVDRSLRRRRILFRFGRDADGQRALERCFAPRQRRHRRRRLQTDGQQLAQLQFMLTVLQDAAVGGMTASKFSTLQTLAAMLNQANEITVSSYVQQIASDVINGNSANATWNGGSSTATTLGNLSATSSQTQANELIGEWFLGTNLPSLSVSGIGEQNLNPTYQTSTLPLFGAGGTPSYLDVNQGYLGDCYFVSSLGETALMNPSLIENMITSNGNGSYSVRFYVNGQADYVTVNSQLPAMGGGYAWANRSTLEFANGPVSWVALVEKAFAELNGQSAAAQYGGHPTGDAYQDLNGGTAVALSEITDQTFNSYYLSQNQSTASLSSLMTTLSSDFKAGDDIILATPNQDNGNLVGDHMYMVTAVNAAAGTISIENPWNTAYSGSLKMSFTDTIAQLAADSVSIYATTGVKVA